MAKKNPHLAYTVLRTGRYMQDEKKPGSDLLSRRRAAVPSARGCFTSVFGMGTGIAALLWPPGDHGGHDPHDPFR